ncbi:MAG: response regulator [Candidatus Competibacteraceae bacterium]|nr:response regulator [Candidatus Competibacteraceae bacterium]
MKPIHILLVEDNEGDILLTREALEDGRIVNRLTVVFDGQEAIDYLERRHQYEQVDIPDLILLDLNLPRKNGHEVLAYIKQSAHLKQIPVIMLTTSSSEMDVNKSYLNHANCYIVKPVEVDDFLRVVTQIENFWITIVQLPTLN